MAGVLYYGDPQALKLYNSSVKSFTVSDDFDEQVAIYDSIATPRMLSDLYVTFLSIPPPTSKQVNVISVLWIFAMTEEIQETKGQTTARNAQTGYQENIESRYDKLLREIKAGEKIVPGAVRGQTVPVISIYTSERVVPSDYESPIVVAEQFPHGLRLGGSQGPNYRNC